MPVYVLPTLWLIERYSLRFTPARIDDDDQELPSSNAQATRHAQY